MADQGLLQQSPGTWGINQAVRRALARIVLDLRAALEDDFGKQLRALGIREDGVQPLPAGRTLTPVEQRLRDVASAVVRREVEGGAAREQAFEAYVRDSAFTFLNRIVGLRCLEERGLLLVDGQPETAIKVDPTRNASSLYWRVRNALGPTTPPREVWRETLRRAGAAISQQVRVLFDPESEYAALLPLQPTLQRVIDALNAPEVPTETYAQDELLGWVYQYYNAREKDAAYARLARGKKLERPAELVAATCLYTERYMVDYLLQNTLGALWLEMHPHSALPDRWPYFVRPPEGTSMPRRPPRPWREITLLDPACGSGHFLVRAFDLLVQMYREEGREPEREIPHLIIERNLHGIDIDLRAVQIAALALYLKGCALAGPGFRPRRLNLVAADALLPGDEPPAGYLASLRGDREAGAVVKGIWQGLKHVREFGSLLHPERAVDEVVGRQREADLRRYPMLQRDDAHWEQWKRELLRGLQEEFERQARSEDLGQRLFGEEASKGVSLVEALGRRYDVVVTNPPYAGSKNLSPRLKAFVEREYKEGKRDLYAAFIQRCRDFARRGGHVGMVTQQSWMFLRSFVALRKDVLEHTSVATLAHSGEHAFEESAAAGAFVAVFTLHNAPPSAEHRLVGFRLVGPKSPTEKDALLRRALAGAAQAIVSTPRQADFLAIPETPLVYWLRRRFFELLQNAPRLGNVAEVRQGLATADDERFTRFVWEASYFEWSRPVRERRWVPFEKGGGYGKWFGHHFWVVDWKDNGARIKASPTAVVRNEQSYFRPGWTYSYMARGSLGLRTLDDGTVFSHLGSAVFFRKRVAGVAALVNCRLASWIVRSISAKIQLNESYVSRVPFPEHIPESLPVLESASVAAKRWLVALDPLERAFATLPLEFRLPSRLGQARPEDTPARSEGLMARWRRAENETNAVQAMLHALEGLNEGLSFDAYCLDTGDIQAVLDETGVPAGWYPLVVGYDALPTSVDGFTVDVELAAHLAEYERRTLNSGELARVRTRLRPLYQAGPGISPIVAEDTSQSVGDEESEEEVVLGARIPIPSETFLEELSQKLEIHPISVYWLLKELREQEGLVSPPLIKQALEDYISVTILRLLGYRWPEQDAYEREHGPILDPALVDEDGIIPLVPGVGQPTALERVRMRLERDFGIEGAEQSEREVRQWVGRDLDDWLRRECFKRHVQQFKQRPIAWHLVSPGRTFEAFVLYHRLSRATLQKLRAQYAGGLIARLRAEQERARQRGATTEVSRLQLQIEDVEEFRARLERIERGDGLEYRIRCRWKGEEESGRPGPYAPDIDDGVKVNIRPFQEAGLLAVKEVIKKW